LLCFIVHSSDRVAVPPLLAGLGGGPLIISEKGHSHRFGLAPAMSGLLLPVVQVFETRKEAEA
jgi:hypothetical protein